MRRLAVLSLAVLAHFTLTILLQRLAFANLILQFVSATKSGPTPGDRLVEAAARGMAFPVVSAAERAGIDLVNGTTPYLIVGLNSAVWVAAAVLLRRAWARRSVRVGAPADGAA